MLSEIKIILKLLRLIIEHTIILLLLILKALIQGIKRAIIKLLHMLKIAFISLKSSLFGEYESENLTLEENNDWYSIYASVSLLQTNYELGKVTNKEKAIQTINRLKDRCKEHTEKYKNDICNRQMQILEELENRMRE